MSLPMKSLMNKKGLVPIVAGIIILGLILLGIYAISEVKILGYSVIGENYENDEFIYTLSKLEPMDLKSVDSLEEYKEFVDKMNTMIDLFNDKFNLDIDRLKKTKSDWNKISNIITKYGPLIGNYNNIIYQCGTHEDSHTPETYSDAYVSVRSFAFEFAILSATSTHKLTFGVIGKIFGKLGIGKIALKCPTCARTIMSSAYWSLKSYIVEESSGMIDKIAVFADEKLNMTL